MKAIFVSRKKDTLKRVYGNGITEKLNATVGIDEKVYDKDDILSGEYDFSDTEYIFSTWGMAELGEDEIRKYLPSLKAVFYAAGTVQYFARPFLNCGISIFSAWAANAVPVAEYTVAQIILANKGFFRLSGAVSKTDYKAKKSLLQTFDGNYRSKVGIIGAGMVGKKVIELLKPYDLEVYVFDPFLPDEKASEMGVGKTELPELFSECNIVSNHLANNEQTKGMINYGLLSSMIKNAAFINTGRGAQVIEKDLIRVLEEREDITALLDVTDPEPPEDGSPLYKLPNCILTPHIAGSSGCEVCRMAEYMYEEYLRFAGNERTLYGVSTKMLETMA